ALWPLRRQSRRGTPPLLRRHDARRRPAHPDARASAPLARPSAAACRLTLPRRYRAGAAALPTQRRAAAPARRSATEAALTRHELGPAHQLGADVPLISDAEHYADDHLVEREPPERPAETRIEDRKRETRRDAHHIRITLERRLDVARHVQHGRDQQVH